MSAPELDPLAVRAIETRATASLWGYLRPHLSRLLWGMVLLLATNALDKGIPWLLRDAVDALVQARFGAVGHSVLALASMALGMGVVRTLSRVAVFDVGRDVELELRNDLLAHLHRLGPSFFTRMPTGETMSRAINDVAQVRVMIGFGLLNSVNSAFAYALALAFMITMSPKLTIWAVLPFPLLAVLARVMGKAMFTRSSASQQALGELSSRVQEALSGIRLTRAFGAERAQEALFERANQNALEKSMALVVVRGVTWPVLVGIASVGTLLVLWRGSAMVRAGTLSVGELVAFLAYVESLKWPTMGLGYILAVLQRGRASFARVREILQTPPDVADAVDAKAPGTVGELRAEKLSFAHGPRPLLREVSLHVPARSSLAIMGRTGSGKSTLAALLARALPTPRGQVFLDGDDITTVRVRELHRVIGFAQQEPFLFSDTVARNIGYALDETQSPSAIARIRAAADAAGILHEIDAMPEGFSTVVGERGVQLSGGQKQRIALARALLADPQVLVMDDPLSAVDAKTEARILHALERAGQGRTLLLVTHRIAAARRCSRIVVLDQGRVVEEGTHDELLAHDGFYKSLAVRQQLEERLGAL